MNTRRCALMSALVAWLVSVFPFAGSAQTAQPPAGFIALFNGRDLSGWRGGDTFDHRKLLAMTPDARADRIKTWTASMTEVSAATGKAHWYVEKGELVNDGLGAYATTEQDYGDFELLVEYRTIAKADSGIYLRGVPQVQIWDWTDASQFNIGADKGSGGLWNNSPGRPGKDPLVLSDRPFGEWNSFRIIMVGSRVSVWLNGRLVVDHAIMENYYDRGTPVPTRGPIQLQTHGGEIRWRNVFLREIGGDEANRFLASHGSAGFAPAFNGRDFTGWSGPVENYEVKDGALACRSGKGGTIYTVEDYRDFAVRLEFALPKGGNNGLAIRYPGSGDTAYDGMCELQVLDDRYEQATGQTIDPRQAHGSAYGMMAAHRGYQRPISEWNFQEVTVRGSRITVELNGVVILDGDLATVKEFMDNRPHPGKDRTSGHFGFAGHDDAVRYRNVLLKPLDDPAAERRARNETPPVLQSKALMAAPSDEGRPRRLGGIMSRLFAMLALALVLMCAVPAAAQEIVMPVIRAPWRNPRDSTPMRLQSLRVDVKIVGHLATTTWDISVFNPQRSVLEGELIFPIGDGQTVSRFAMDVNGALREGVVVEKEKGRQVFEEIVRRNIDPGLLEKTSGNSFRARVYPIPAGGSKRVIVAYEQELKDAGTGAAAGLLYHLPLAFTDKVDSFTLRVEVLDQAEIPRVQSSPLATFAFKAWQRAFVAEDTQRDIVLDKALTVVVPKGEEGHGAFVSTEQGERYFYVTVSPRLSRQSKTLPKRLLVVWDASYSARLRDRKKELELLDAYVQKLGSARIALAILRNDLDPVRSGAWAELRKTIEEAPPDGGTHFGALDLSKEQADEVLLFSDGLGTFGGGEPRFPNCPVMAVNTALAANHGWLRGVSEPSGGEYLNLATQTVADALGALTTQPLTFLRASFDAKQIDEVYPSRGAAVRGPFGVAGKLRAERAKVTLHFGYGTKESYSRTFDLDATAEVTAPVARIWAQKKLAELSQAPGRNAEAIVALGRQFGIVTEGTSLIVLDSVADYVRYSIEPPKELLAEYQRLMKEQDNKNVRGRKDHLEKVVAQFEERKTWWRTEFKPDPIKDKVVVPAGGEASPESPRERQDVRAAMTGAPPPSAPMPAQARAEQEPAGARRPPTDAGGRGQEPEVSGTVELKPWAPDTPYLKELKAAAKDQRYAIYLKLRAEHGTTPGYFLDVSDLFREQGDSALALRILSNLAELKVDDPTLLRVLGYRLRQLGLSALAVWTFEQVLTLREDEPQSHRDLALALADAGQTQRAVDLMWDLVARQWDERFRDVNLIVVGEMNATIATAKSRPSTSRIDSRLLENLPVDVRAVLNWDTPNSDMDLHIIDPRGEECYYSHPRTAIGGRISADITTGYGPEEFLLRKAIPGKYAVRAKFFGTGQQTAVGATTVVLELYLRYGTGQAENKSITLRLDGPGRMVEVGTFTFEVRAK